jgi:hypothetical protein
MAINLMMTSPPLPSAAFEANPTSPLRPLV